MKTRIPGKITTLIALTALLGQMLVQGADVSEYGVLKGMKYTQGDAGTPDDSFVFYWVTAYARLTAAGLVSEASATLPEVGAVPLFEQGDPKLWQFETVGGLALPDFNAAFPNGDYLVAMTTANDGSRQASLNLTGDAYPNTPTFQSFTALESVDPAADFTLRWSAFAGGTANDFVQVRVVDDGGAEVFSTPMLGAAGALGGAATSAVIPANTLAPDSHFTVTLTFLKVITLDSSSYPGALGLAGYYKSTEVSLATTTGSGGGDTTPPQLVSSIPLNGASGVTVNSPVIFVFNEAMAEAESIAWSANLSAGSFTYDWSVDGRTLTCVYLGSLPAGATCTWTLNPPTQPQDFQDVAGNPLPAGIYSGSFSTATSSATNNPCEPVDDGRGYGGVTKELFYVQTSAAAPAPDPERHAVFLGSVTSPTNNPVTSAKLQVPGGPLLTLTNFFGRAFLDMEEYASQSALDTARPAGNYEVQLTRTSGSPSASVSLTSLYPPTPEIRNYAACQAVDPAADFTVQWNGFGGATANDGIGLSIVYPDPMNIWQWVAPDPCVPRELANTATSVTIPAGTLQPGKTYEASLTYSRLTDAKTNAIADTTLAAFLQKMVSFTIRTTGSSGDSARFVGNAVLPNGTLELILQGAAGQSFLIEASDSLQGEWTTVSMQTIPAGGVATFQVVIDGESGYFRARKL